MTEALLRLLFGTSVLARSSAAYAIGRHWDGQMNIIDTLLAHFTNPDVSARVSAVQAFIFIENKRHEITDALLPQLADSSWLVREAAAEALALRRLDGSQPNVVTALLLTLSDPSPRVRAEAARALQIPEGENSPIIEALLQATSDPDWFVRESAASALSTSQNQIEVIGERLEQLLQQYEHIAYRDLRGYNPIFNALEEITKKV